MVRDQAVMTPNAIWKGDKCSTNPKDSKKTDGYSPNWVKICDTTLVIYVVQGRDTTHCTPLEFASSGRHQDTY